MAHDELNPRGKKRANFRLCNVSSYTTELLEIDAEVPKLHVLIIPGNPGVVSFYKDFVESLYELLGCSASITVIGHISQTIKNWEHGRLFSLEEQIIHKIDFIKQELQNVGVPILLVFEFLSFRSPIRCVALSSLAGLLGLLPSWASRFVVKKSIGQSWSATALEAACTHLLQYHSVRNILFMAMTEFEKLSETPDWEFVREKQGQIAFLFGIDDHWGPLSMYEEISKQGRDISLSIEREGYAHAYCCSEDSSLWVAQYVASLIKNNIFSLIQ